MFSALRRWWKGEKPKGPSNQGSPRPPRIFVLDSLFLKDCHAFLTREQRIESLVYATGILSKGIAIPHRLVPVGLSDRSAVHAKADPWSSHKALMALDEAGHALLGVFHTHPWKGSHAVFPSSTDIATQEAYERKGYPCISGIFSLDGYIRLFTLSAPLRIVVYGEGIEKYEQGLYRIRT